MLIDSYGRRVEYLRVSVTERCNFRCQYCMPEKPFSWVPKENLLRFEELFIMVKVAINEGITKIRITGGEPTLREDLDKFIKMIYDYAPNIDLSMTTNGYTLASSAKKLKDAGLKRVNISLDSLKPDVAKIISNKDILNSVIKGIMRAKNVGLGVKLNMVPLKGINDNEILNLLNYAKSHDIQIRFIEYMQNSFAKEELVGLTSSEIIEKIDTEYKVEDIGYINQSPSHNYKLEDGYTFGIIEPHKDDFCEQCNRIRLTAEGNIIPCLYFDEALSIASAVKSGNIEEAAEILGEVVIGKPEKNRWGKDDSEISSRAFYETGG